MANEQNLISLADRTTSEKREIAIKGGVASGEARRAKKTMAEFARAILEAKINSVSDLKLGSVPCQDNSVAAAIFAVHANKAMEGDVSSAKFLVETVEKETNKGRMLGGFQFVIEPGDEQI